MKFRPLLLIAFSLLAAVSGFAQAGMASNSLIRHIPPNQDVIYHIQCPAITNMISWQDLIGLIPAKDMSKLPPSAARYMQDPALAGLDLNKDIIVSEKKPTESKAGYTTVIIPLLDSARFRAALRRDGQGFHFLPPAERSRLPMAFNTEEAIVWNKDHAFLVFVVKPTKPAEQQESKKPTLATSYRTVLQKKALETALGFDNSSYNTDPIFQREFPIPDNNTVLIIWNRQNGFNLFKNKFGKKMGPMAQFLGNDKDTVDHPTVTAIHLLDGKITMTHKSFAAKETIDMMTKYTGRPLNMDLQEKIPQGNLLGVMNFHFDMQLLSDFLEKRGLRHMLDSLMSAKGLPMDTFLSAFTGDFQLVSMEPTLSVATGKPVLPAYFAMTIKDTAAFAKIKSIFNSIFSPGSNDSSGRQPNPLAKMNIHAHQQGNYLIIGRADFSMNDWLNNTQKRDATFIDPSMKEAPISVFIDFKVISHFMETMTAGKELSEKDKKTQDILKSLDQVKATGGLVRGDHMEGAFELQLTDTSHNSLLNFIKLLR